MRSNYVVFERDTGEIVGTYFSSYADAHLLHDPAALQDVLPFDRGAADLPEALDATHYVEDPAGTPTLAAKTPGPATIDRPQILADGVDVATISTVPAGAVVYHNGVWAPPAVDGGVLEFTTNLVGLHEITLISVRHLEQTITVRAV